MKNYNKYLTDNTGKERCFSRLKRGFLVLTASALTLSIFAVTSTAAYDPSKDPLVTVSYLNAEKVKIKTEVEQSILSKLGFANFEDLKNAINSGGSGSTVNEAAIIEKAKSGVLSELGFTTYAKLKESILNVSSTEKSSINTMVQNNILTQLGFKTMVELKAKINQSATINQAGIDSIVGQVKADLLKELAYPSFASLKKAISDKDSSGGGSSPADAVQYFIQQLGYSTIGDLKKDLEKIDNTETSQPVTSQPIIPLPVSGGYETVSLKRGQTIIVENNCEAILTSGLVGIVGNYINSGVADITAGAIIGNKDILDIGHSYIIPKPENSYALICVSTDAVIFIRGDYEIN